MKFGMVMDPIGSINFKKDSTLSILIEAQSRKHDLIYMEPNSLFLREDGAYALTQEIKVRDDSENWFELSDTSEMRLSVLDMIVMRQDPPFDANYIYNTYVLEAAEREEVIVVNKPQSLRDCNEKVFATEFPQCCTPFLVTSNQSLLFFTTGVLLFCSSGMVSVILPFSHTTLSPCCNTGRFKGESYSGSWFRSRRRSLLHR